MTTEVNLLVATALSVGCLHTLLGPDHYIPFVAMARSNDWTVRKTVWITTLCGLGHIAGSVLLGAIGLLIGAIAFQLEAIESFRGDAAAWLLIGFGVAYLTWGIANAIRDIPHTHLHAHMDGTVHSHLHQHDLAHRHLHQPEHVNGKEVVAIGLSAEHPAELSTEHSAELSTEHSAENSAEQAPNRASLTPWVLFLIFAFGPCEVLIPLLMYPAAEANRLAIFAVVVAFSFATVATMVTSVLLIVYGMQWMKVPNLHRFSHAIAGLAVLLCGVLMKCGL